ncbi:MAG TPA: helix-turn-helix domain-containing protein [Chitinophagaceae bacterium]|nr:helix-turn-helix domain-containing protein [Chitinophagaceae bacterium]
MFYLAGIIITFFLSVLLAGKKGKSEADKVLTAWLIIIGLHLTMFYLYLSGNFLKFTWLLGLHIPLPLVHGPFLFLYTTALTQARGIKAEGLLHFIPVFIIYGLMLPFFQLPADQKIAVYQRGGSGYEWLTDWVFIAIIVSGITYVILSFLKLRQHKINIENQFSNTARINLNWLGYLIFGTSVIWAVILFGLGDTFIFGGVVLYVFFMGYFGIRQVGIFSNKPSLVEPVSKNEGNPKAGVKNVWEVTPVPNLPDAKLKYQKSSLTAEEATRIHQQLEHLMLKDKLFKDPELSLGQLAEMLNVHSNVLSQVINSFENKNFYDYINSLRIAEFKTLAADPGNRQYTLLSLAYECGFNSKTAFNRNFKKVTGASPTEYLSKVNVNLA